MSLFQRTVCVIQAMVLLVLMGCSTTPSTFSGSISKSKPPAAEAPHRPSPTSEKAKKAQEVTVYALGLVGTPYRFGGNTPDSGLDCSGLIVHVYRTVSGLIPPRTVARLQGWGQEMATSELQTGDVVIFFTAGVASHAGIYVGENRFVHAPSTGGRVRMGSLRSNYWRAKKIMVRRP